MANAIAWADEGDQEFESLSLPPMSPQTVGSTGYWLGTGGRSLLGDKP